MANNMCGGYGRFLPLIYHYIAVILMTFAVTFLTIFKLLFAIQWSELFTIVIN